MPTSLQDDPAWDFRVSLLGVHRAMVDLTCDGQPVARNAHVKGRTMQLEEAWTGSLRGQPVQVAWGPADQPAAHLSSRSRQRVGVQVAVSPTIKFVA